jgi:hypothetical protein
VYIITNMITPIFLLFLLANTTDIMYNWNYTNTLFESFYQPIREHNYTQTWESLYHPIREHNYTQTWESLYHPIREHNYTQTWEYLYHPVKHYTRESLYPIKEHNYTQTWESLYQPTREFVKESLYQPTREFIKESLYQPTREFVKESLYQPVKNHNYTQTWESLYVFTKEYLYIPVKEYNYTETFEPLLKYIFFFLPFLLLLLPFILIFYCVREDEKSGKLRLHLHKLLMEERQKARKEKIKRDQNQLSFLEKIQNLERHTFTLKDEISSLNLVIKTQQQELQKFTKLLVNDDYHLYTLKQLRTYARNLGVPNVDSWRTRDSLIYTIKLLNNVLRRKSNIKNDMKNIEKCKKRKNNEDNEDDIENTRRKQPRRTCTPTEFFDWQEDEDDDVKNDPDYHLGD